MPNKTVTLEKPIVGHRPYRQLEFREPMFRDIMALGDPFVWVPMGEDLSRRVDDFPAIEKYAERLLVEDGKQGDPLILDQLGIRDTRKVREVVISFFQEAAAQPAASKTSPESSSSTQASTQEPSEA